MAKAYYNEFDRQKAAWLRELIKRGVIAPGDVDERSIKDVQSGDLDGYTQCHFFAGIGVWSYALRLAGWPDDREVWTGSCPCQSFSVAGKRKGFNDERHLFPDWFRLIAERKPRVVFGEQSSSKDALAWLDLVQSSMEETRYAFGALDICAAGFGAPHIRQRLYFVADSANERWQRGWTSETCIESSPLERLDGLCAPGFVDHTRCECDESRRGSRHLGCAPETQQSQVQEWQRCGNANSDSVSTGGVADADGGVSWDGAVQRGGQHGQQPQDGGTGELAHSESQDGQISVLTGGPQQASTEFGGGCGVGVVEQPCGERWERRQETAPGYDDDGQTSLRSQSQHGPCESGAFGLSVRPGPTNGFWRDADWLRCTDGKWRPVEAGTFPLSHGAPARVGRLRGYGDAIVAPEAAEFIAAYMETCNAR